MDRAFKSGASATPPTAPASPSIGYPTAGNASTGTPPTEPGPWFYHMITEELRAIVFAGGLTPSQETLDQVLQALPSALASRPEMARSLATTGYQKLPGGLIIQWGIATISSTTGTTITFPITFPTIVPKVVSGYSGGSAVGVSDPSLMAETAGNVTNSSFVGRHFYNGTPSTTSFYHWLAIGF